MKNYSIEFVSRKQTAEAALQNSKTIILENIEECINGLMFTHQST
jgi:hypothetical protein